MGVEDVELGNEGGLRSSHQQYSTNPSRLAVTGSMSVKPVQHA